MKTNWILWSLLGCMLLALPACEDEEEDPAEALKALLAQQDQQITNYLNSNNIDAEKGSLGIYREVLTANPQGEAIEEGDVVILHYTFKTLNGTLFATSEGSEPELITYDPSRTYLPTSLFRNLGHLRVGERYRFYVPSPYAFSSFTDGDKLPANSIIIMELEAEGLYHSLDEIHAVELTQIADWIDAENITTTELEGGLQKELLQAGTGVQPVNGDTVQLRYKGYLLSKEVFDQNLDNATTFDFKLGTNTVVSGFEQAVKSMRVGEKARFIMPSRLGYGRNGVFALPRTYFDEFKQAGLLAGNASPIPPFSPLVFEMELVGIK